MADTEKEIMNEIERRKDVFLTWLIEDAGQSQLLAADGRLPTPEEIADAKEQLAVEHDPEVDLIVKLIERAELGERAAIVKHLRACGATVTADAIESGRHRA